MTQRICSVPPLPPRSPYSTPTDFVLSSYLKDAVYNTKPETLQELRQEIQLSGTAIPEASLVVTCQSVADRCQLCHEVNGGHFEHLH
jgi:hypothetical protein